MSTEQHLQVRALIDHFETMRNRNPETFRIDVESSMGDFSYESTYVVYIQSNPLSQVRCTMDAEGMVRTAHVVLEDDRGRPFYQETLPYNSALFEAVLIWLDELEPVVHTSTLDDDDDDLAPLMARQDPDIREAEARIRRGPFTLPLPATRKDQIEELEHVMGSITKALGREGSFAERLAEHESWMVELSLKAQWSCADALVQAVARALLEDDPSVLSAPLHAWWETAMARAVDKAEDEEREDLEREEAEETDSE